jgi:hypothetical protein
VRERGGYVNKTKLVKYLYLIDLEHYRSTARLLTGFDWQFHLYGPWAKEFEDLYRSLADRSEIKVRVSNRTDLDAEFLSTDEHVDFKEVVGDFALECRRIIDQWADRRLGEMLDYVYFYTEPMERATRGESLDFSHVERPTQPLVWPASRPDPSAVRRIRDAIAQRKASMSNLVLGIPTPPQYDEAYFDALETMEHDEGY